MSHFDIKMLVRCFERKVESADGHLAEFVTKMQDAPWHALEWSGIAFGAAADKKVYSTMLEAIRAARHRGSDDETIFGILKQYALRESLRIARNPPRSTSPTSNLMEQCIGTAWAEALDRYLSEEN
jgi:hypothetical protein